jgi:hypothetical protein
MKGTLLRYETGIYSILGSAMLVAENQTSKGMHSSGELMIRRFLLGISASILLSSSVAAQSLVTTAQVKLRRHPTSSAHVIALLGQGTSLDQLSPDSLKNGYIWVMSGSDTGWVFKRYTHSATGSHAVVPGPPTGPVTALSSCPMEGRSASGKKPGPADAASNKRKRNQLPLGNATTLTFADFLRLQSDVEHLFNIDSHTQTLTLLEADRAKLHNLPLASGSVSEGDLVQLMGYLVLPDAHPNTGEGVNCNLAGPENNDFHITVGPSLAANAGYQGIVVEMIPQQRPSEWSIQNLLRVEADKRPVLVVGQLFYDMKHKVNDDPAHKMQGQPVRAIRP